MKKILSVLFLLVSINSLVCQSLEEILFSEKNPEKLIEILQIFYKKSDNPGEKLGVLLNLAYLEEILGNLDTAQKHYQEAAFLFVNQQSHTALLRSAFLLFELGEHASSLEQAKIVKELSKNLEEREIAELLIIRNLLAEEKREEADAIFNSMTKDLEKSRNLPLLYGLYDLAMYLKNEETAQKIISLLKNNFPNTLETDLMSHRIDPYPSFFHYFLNNPKKELEQITAPEQKNRIIYIQLGSFLDRENAEYRKIDADRAGFPVEIKEVLLNNRIYYRLLLPVEEENIQNMILQLKEKGFEGYPLYPAIQ